MSLLLEFSQTLYDTQFSTDLRESVYVFPIIEGLHLLGLAFSVGLIALTDLRLIGKFLREESAADILTQLRPWVLGGFALTFATGILLFISESVKVLENPAFPIKLVLLFLAGLNALWFELKLGRKVNEWGALPEVPSGVKFAGWASLILWTGVVLTGRLIPYLG